MGEVRATHNESNPIYDENDYVGRKGTIGSFSSRLFRHGEGPAMRKLIALSAVAVVAALTLATPASAHPARDRECGGTSMFSRIQSGADRHQLRPVSCRTAKRALRYLLTHPMDRPWRAAGRRWEVDGYQTEEGCWVTIYSGMRRVYAEHRRPWGQC